MPTQSTSYLVSPQAVPSSGINIKMLKMTQFGIPLRTATNSEEPEIDNETLIRLMVDMAMRETENRIMQKVRNLLADYDEQLLLKVGRMIDNHVPLTTQTAQSTPTEQKRPLPNLADITRMRSQLFENFRKPKAKQIKNQARCAVEARHLGVRWY